MDEIRELQNRFENEKSIENLIICTIEEMSEATKVLTKYLRNSPKFTIDNLTEEVAHTLLMLDVIKNVFNLNETDIDNERLKALKKCFNTGKSDNE